MRLIVALLLALVAGRAHADVDMKTCNVTATSSTCIVANRARVHIELRNVGGTNIAYCSTLCPATTTNGFPLGVNGTTAWVEDGNERAQSKICCITSASTTTVAIREHARAGALTAPTPSPVPTP